MKNPQGERLSTQVLANWYDSAATKAELWANSHSDYSRNGPWKTYYCDVAA